MERAPLDPAGGVLVGTDVMIRRITLRKLDLPLSSPYRLSYRTFHTFEPYLVEVEDDGGRRAVSDAQISPGSSAETREGGWAFLAARLPRLIGRSPCDAMEMILRDFEQSKVASTAIVTALEILAHSPLLDVERATDLPLLVPVGSTEQADIEEEVETAIRQGFTTLKVKVGKDVEADVRRLGWIQKAANGRALLRVDANRAYSREDAIRFAARVSPQDIALFEQPCEAEAWEDNAAVASVSDIPLMLDEPICTLADIERAANIPGVEFCKLKLKRFGGIARLAEGIRQVQAHGMSAVLGDGLGTDLHAWLEACVAAHTIDNAGEFNGFLKMKQRLFKHALPFSDGAIRLPAGYRPELDSARIEAVTTQQTTFD